MLFLLGRFWPDIIFYCFFNQECAIGDEFDGGRAFFGMLKL